MPSATDAAIGTANIVRQRSTDGFSTPDSAATSSSVSMDDDGGSVAVRSTSARLTSSSPPCSKSLPYLIRLARQTIECPGPEAPVRRPLFQLPNFGAIHRRHHRDARKLFSQDQPHLLWG